MVSQLHFSNAIFMHQVQITVKSCDISSREHGFMIDPQRSWREIFIEGYERRRLRNRSYSIRSFARDIGFSPAYVSGLIAGRFNLSGKGAQKVSEKLRFSDLESQIFCTLVEVDTAKSSAVRENARKRLEKLKETHFQSVYIPHDQSKFRLNTWIEMAILEVVSKTSRKLDVQAIATCFDVSIQDVLHHVDRLTSQGYLALEEGSWKLSPGYSDIKNRLLVFLNQFELHCQTKKHGDRKSSFNVLQPEIFIDAPIFMQQKHVEKVRSLMYLLLTDIRELASSEPENQDSFHVLHLELLTPRRR